MSWPNPPAAPEIGWRDFSHFLPELTIDIVRTAPFKTARREQRRSRLATIRK
jgi:hypothetical protein